MKLKFTAILAVFFCLYTAHAFALVESKVVQSISIEKSPLDVAGSIDGRWTYVLTEGGKLYIYAMNGELNDVIDVDPDMDHIFVAGRDGEKLFVSSKVKKKVELIALTFAAEIDTSGSPFLGNPDAPVEIVVFSDFQCPYCAKMGAVFEEILENNPDKVKIVYKHFPLSSHRYSSLAALASIAAQEQGKFWYFHDKMFASYKDLNQQIILQAAQDLNLDMQRFNRDVGSKETKEKLSKDINDGKLAGVRGTPTVFVNGRQPYGLEAKDIQQFIDAELKLLEKSK